jgi:hypothetical protein
VYGHAVAGLHRGHRRPDRRHFTREFMPRYQWFANDEVADPAMIKIMKVRATDTTGPYSHFYIVLT